MINICWKISQCAQDTVYNKEEGVIYYQLMHNMSYLVPKLGIEEAIGVVLMKEKGYVELKRRDNDYHILKSIVMENGKHMNYLD